MIYKSEVVGVQPITAKNGTQYVRLSFPVRAECVGVMYDTVFLPLSDFAGRMPDVGDSLLVSSDRFGKTLSVGSADNVTECF